MGEHARLPLLSVVQEEETFQFTPKPANNHKYQRQKSENYLFIIHNLHFA